MKKAMRRVLIVSGLTFLFAVGLMINYILWDVLGLIMWPINYAILLFLWHPRGRGLRQWLA